MTDDNQPTSTSSGTAAEVARLREENERLRRALRESEAALRRSDERLRRAMSIDSVGVLMFDMEGAFLDANDAFLRMIGYDRDALERGELRSDVVTLPEWMPRTRRVFADLQEHGRFNPYVKELVRPDGTRWWGLFAGARVAENEGIEFVIDVTDRRRMEEQLRGAVEEKQRLMRELNHRVKNNLSMVSSLVNLKDASLGSDADLSDIRGQMDTIAFLHEKLYQQDAVSTVVFEPYVRDLLTEVFSFYPGRGVELRVSAADASLPSDTATTLGLILNELATNAMKHGFTAEIPPSFAVALERATDEEYLITVSQSGREFPEDVALADAGSSGLGLVRLLVDQLRGSIALEHRPSPTFTIRVPVEGA